MSKIVKEEVSLSSSYGQIKYTKIMYTRLKELYSEVKNHTDLSIKSQAFFAAKVKEIRVELLKVAAVQAEQITRDVSDAMRLIHIAEREDLNNINEYQNFTREISKHLGRVRDTVLTRLEFVNKQKSR